MDEVYNQPKSQRPWLKLGLALLVLLSIGFGLGGWLASVEKNKIAVPQSTLDKITFPIYLPKEMPGNYKIEEHSFVVDEGTLVFKASDGAGGSIAFTEQKKPDNFNFEGFFAQQLRDAVTLDNVPFPSVAGKSIDTRSSILSIVTNDTWILATTQSPITADNLKIVAKSVAAYRQD